jgi:4-oxalmesaconate hydratase
MGHHFGGELISRYWTEHENDLIYRVEQMFPDNFVGVCALPQSPGVPPAKSAPELERCVNELGFVACNLSPDPSGGYWQEPPLTDRAWYPLYEKMVELDVPALVHSTACKHFRESYSAHFISEESIAVLNLCKADSRVFTDFPDLRIIISHGGGSVPYQIGRWRAHRFREQESNPSLESFDDSLRRLYYDTVLYNVESLDFLFRIVGTDRCLFGTENPGSGSSKDPGTGAWMDDLKPVIESIPWLSETDRSRIFEDNIRAVFPRFQVHAQVP